MRGFSRASAPRSHSRISPAACAPVGLAVGRFGQHRFQVVERHPADVLARAHQVERGVDGRAVQETGHVAHRLGRGIALQHAQKNGLHGIFRVAGVAGDPVGGAEDHGVVLAKDLFQIHRGLAGRFHGGYGLRFHPIRLCMLPTPRR